MEKQIIVKKSVVNKKSQTGASLILLFLQGLIFTTIAYINKPLAELVLAPAKQKWSVALAIPQVTGDLMVCMSATLVLKKFNMRTVLCSAFALATTALFLLTLLDYIIKVHGQKFSSIPNQTRNLGLGIYIVLSLMIGMGTSYTVCIINTFLGTIHTDQARVRLVSAGNGLYSFGAGFAPLCLSVLVFQLYKPQDNYSLLRSFLIIATVAGFLACCTTLIFNYRFRDHGHDLSLLAQKGHQKIRKSDNYWLLFKIGPYIFLALLFFDLAQVNAGYGLNNYVGGNLQNKSVLKTLVRAIGLYFLVQGLWSLISPLIFKKVKNYYFVLMMGVFCAVGFGLLAGKTIDHDLNLIYLIAILLGIGIGNTGSVIFAFFQGSYEERRAWIGIILGIIRMITYEIGITVVAFAPTTPTLLLAITILATVLLFLVGGLMILYRRLVTKKDDSPTTNL